MEEKYLNLYLYLIIIVSSKQKRCFIANIPLGKSLKNVKKNMSNTVSYASTKWLSLNNLIQFSHYPS